ncbi:C45 family autoproteolytic acyltransferase/hydrolase [Salinisphaera sp. RV14]|uniref:C45 family autoproteolytic acyltransferase/hydolase n=1 Tax=Salinisphaera sp. RV14 TaxID=3454140 RepID=UPI003F843A62
MSTPTSPMAHIPSTFHLASIEEDEPGAKWQALFDAHWPPYQTWFLSEGERARPGYMTSLRNLRAYMPELLSTYDKLVDLAGGGDLAARFLSFYRPPPYLLGCSQAVWAGPEPALIRNYDYSPILFEWALLKTRWLRPVIAISDCLWGVLDGINDAGLAVSLAFGGRKTTGDGFGVPLVLRYILETCDNVREACFVLRRVPVHMTYNLTLLDRAGIFVTAYLAPDRKPRFVRSPVSTNHQDRIEWPAYARMSASIERRAFLEERLADPSETESRFVNRFLEPPIHRIRYERAFGTLYTAVYRPTEARVEYHWPGHRVLQQSFASFEEGLETIHLGEATIGKVGVGHF